MSVTRVTQGAQRLGARAADIDDRPWIDDELAADWRYWPVRPYTGITDR